jgi:hypothetical protein
VSQLEVVVDFGETCGLDVGVYRGVQQADAAAWVRWRCTAEDVASDGAQGEAGGGLSSSTAQRNGFN